MYKNKMCDDDDIAISVGASSFSYLLDSFFFLLCIPKVIEMVLVLFIRIESHVDTERERESEMWS